MTIDFEAWPKTSRMFRDIVVTEKIDGTNAAIIFEDGVTISDKYVLDAAPLRSDEIWDGKKIVHVGAQSRKRLVTPESDNFGFAKWVHDNAQELYGILGPGRHFGEWWGKGIQKGYGQDSRHFYLFNTGRYEDVNVVIGGSHVAPVPVIYSGMFDQQEIVMAADYLHRNGSIVAPNYGGEPEGVCIYHTQSGKVYKYTPYHGYDGSKGL